MQFLYVLKLTPRLVQPENWTQEDEAIVGEHFNYLKKLLAEGKLILAGKTDGIDEKTFGVVVFEAGSREEADAVMLGDPAVAKGVMAAELFPYRVALLRGGQ